MPLEIFITAFVTFFVTIDPVGVAPIFAGLTGDKTKKEKNSIALKAVFASAVVLFLFGLFGKGLLDTLGISLDAFQVAGGLLLLLVAIDMVFEKRSQRRSLRASEWEEEKTQHDIAIFPLAIPMIAGPSAITAVMLGVTEHQGHLELQALAYGALGLVLLINYIILLGAGWLLKLAGPAVTTGFTRILGVILAALSVQYVFDGVVNLFGL